MQKPYRTIDEIADIFGITIKKVNDIIKKYKVDNFVHKGIKIHVKDFYAAYTKYYNPSLFDLQPKKPSKSKDITTIFHKLFGCPYTVH